MRRGARSIRGAMGTYFWVALGCLALLALVLWWRGSAGVPGVEVRLQADGPWAHATLDDGQDMIVITPGEVLEVRPGRWRLTLVPAARGAPVMRSVSLPSPRSGDGPLTLGPELGDPPD